MILDFLPPLLFREIGLFGCDVGLFIRDIQAHLKIHNIHSYYHQTTRIYTFHTHAYVCICQYICGSEDSLLTVPAGPYRISDGSSRTRRGCDRRTRCRSTARHVITPSRFTYSGRGDTGLFCRYAGLFCDDIGLICSDFGFVDGGMGFFCTCTPYLTTLRPCSSQSSFALI